MRLGPGVQLQNRHLTEARLTLLAVAMLHPSFIDLPRSPKLAPRRPGSGRTSDWYHYYAGYAPTFVEDVLKPWLDAKQHKTVLDPWNGSGTTTAVAHAAGLSAVGFDLNPALVLVAIARVLGREVYASLDALTEELINDLPTMAVGELPDGHEPLANWFTPETSALLRRMERLIYRTFVHSAMDSMLAEVTEYSKVSSLAAYFYVILFDVGRQLFRSLMPSNPTWVPASVPPPSRVTTTDDHFLQRFRATQTAFQRHLDSAAPIGSAFDSSLVISAAPSTALPLDGETIDVTVTSPPYCTRIDYIAASRIELAIMGFADSEITNLRKRMIGTPITDRQSTAVVAKSVASRQALVFLDAVKKHPSKASSTYYYRCFVRYFVEMQASVSELYRVTRPHGALVMVVQDSFYKEIHNNLAAIIEELSISCGWSVAQRVHFPLRRTRAIVNPGSRKYRTTFGAVETVLSLVKQKTGIIS